MAQATFVQSGCATDYTPSSAVAAGDVVVQGDLVGVAKRPIAANEAGALEIDGVFDFAKDTGVAYTVGTILYWDGTNDVVTTTATGNKQIGKVIRAASTTDTTVRARLRQ